MCFVDSNVMCKSEMKSHPSVIEFMSAFDAGVAEN